MMFWKPLTSFYFVSGYAMKNVIASQVKNGKEFRPFPAVMHQ